MNTLEAIAQRYSERNFRAQQIDEKDLELLLKAGMQAPVASGHYDSLHITVVRNPEALKRIAEMAADIVEEVLGVRKNMDFGAQTLILISSKPALLAGIEYANAACVLENMVIAAADLGIDSLIWGGCASAVNEDNTLREMLEIPEGFKTLLGASFGYAKEKQLPKTHEIEVNRID